MTEPRKAEAVSFAFRIALVHKFDELFKTGMALVEETANYLDGTGRQESKQLKRVAALIYARESMRLTVRLMAAASWLVLTRAFKETEISSAQYALRKKKIKLPEADEKPPECQELPTTLQDLITRAFTLVNDVSRFDRMLEISGHDSPPEVFGRVDARALQDILRAHFERT